MRSKNAGLALRILVVVIMVISCNSYKLPSGTPDAIIDRINDFEKNHNCAEVQVDKYTLNSKFYYCFLEDCCCDIGSDWYDSNGNYVGTTGTFAGTINATIPLENMTYVETIWAN